MKHTFLKKLLVVAACAWITTSNAQSAQEKETAITNAEKALVSNHTLAFSKNNLTLGYITEDESKGWDSAIASIQKVIQDQAPASLKKDGLLLCKYALQIKDALRVIFETQIRPALTTKKAKTEGISASAFTQDIDYTNLPIDRKLINMKSISNMVNLIKSLRGPIKTIETSINNNSACKPKKGKPQDSICRLLQTLVVYLDTTIVAISNHFETFKKELPVDSPDPEFVRWHDEK